MTAGTEALADGDVAAAVRLLQQAGRNTATSGNLGTEIGSALAQALLQAGQPVKAADTAAAILSAADGSDPPAAVAMRLVLARAAVMTAAWTDARAQLAAVRHAGAAGEAASAEVAVIDAQIAIGDSTAGSRAGAEALAARAAALATGAGLAGPDLRSAGDAGLLRPLA